MGGKSEAWVGTPDWAREPLEPFAYVDETVDGFTELRVHGVSGPPPDRVLDYPAEMVTLVRGNATSGFWRRWRLSGSLADVPHRHRLEAFIWGGLTSRAALQALWLPLLPFSLVNLAHWMLPPYYTTHFCSKKFSYAAISLLRVLGLSFTVTLALAGAEVMMDLVAWQCGRDSACLATLQRHDLLGRFLDDPGPRLAVAGGLLFLALLLLLLAGNTFDPLSGSDKMKPPVVSRDKDGAVLGHPQFWAVDHSTRWLRCLHAVAWCTATGAVATGALAVVRPPVQWKQSPGSVVGAGHTVPSVTVGAGPTVGAWFAGCNLFFLAVVVGLAFCQYFGRGGKGPERTTGYRLINLAAGGLLVASLTVTAVYLPAHPDGSQLTLPYVQDALRLLAVGQAVILFALVACVSWLAVCFALKSRTAPLTERQGSRPWRPLLCGMLAVVVALLGWLLGLAQSAGYDRWVADRLRGGAAPGSLTLPSLYSWINAYAVLALFIAGVWAGALALRVVCRTKRVARSVATCRPAEPGGEGARDLTPAEMSRARSAARFQILAQSVETIPWLLAVIAGTGCLFLIVCWHEDPTRLGWFAAIASGGAWVITTGTAGTILIAYIAFRKQSTRRIIGILWDVTTFWPRANHPLTPACSAQRAVPQLAGRIVELTREGNDSLILSAHSQGSVLAAAAVLRLGRDTAHSGALERMSLLTYGSPLRRLYARGFPAYFSVPVLEEVWGKAGRRWLNLWAETDPIGASIALPPAKAADIDWQMLPDPLTLAVDPRTGEPVKVCDHSGFVSRPEYPVALESLRDFRGDIRCRLTRHEGRALLGNRGYALRMPASQLPGAGGAWSVTLYERQGERERPFCNALMRFSLGSGSEGLRADTDGGIRIYVQASPPDGQQSNWLPAPMGEFNLVLRVDWPSAELPVGWTCPLHAIEVGSGTGESDVSSDTTEGEA
jgi:hypothetical protein